MIRNGKAIAFDNGRGVYRVQTMDEVPVTLTDDFATSEEAQAWAITGKRLTQNKAAGVVRMADRVTPTKRFEGDVEKAVAAARELLTDLLGIKTAYDNGIGDVVNATAPGETVADTIFVKEQLLALHEMAEAILVFAASPLPTTKVTPLKLLNSL